MPFIETEIPAILEFEPKLFPDSRGYFFEAYNEKNFTERGIDIRFVQDNQSSSEYGVIRGLHYQMEPYAQSKLIRVLEGEILDVAVDIRRGSPYYGEKVIRLLSAENRKQLFIPKGFAHGFSVLSKNAVVLYKCDNFYNKSSEAGIRFDDPQLNIDWKVPVEKAIISEKDIIHPYFADFKNNFDFKG